jgi:integrase
MAGGVGPHTPNRDLACMRAALTHAKDDGLLDRIPKIRMLRTVQAMPRVLTPDEIHRLLDHAGDLRPLIATAAGTGMRAAELRWLSFDCLSLAAKTIEVRAKLDWRPKTHCERTVRIPDRLVEVLAKHRENVLSSPTDWVFPVPSHGGQWSETGLSHAVRRVAEKSGVWRPGSKPLHDLRRSWASHLMAAGTPMDTVRRLGGWASHATLEKFYLAPTEQALVRAVEASDSLI